MCSPWWSVIYFCPSTRWASKTPISSSLGPLCQIDPVGPQVKRFGLRWSIDQKRCYLQDIYYYYLLASELASHYHWINKLKVLISLVGGRVHVDGSSSSCFSSALPPSGCYIPAAFTDRSDGEVGKNQSAKFTARWQNIPPISLHITI